VWTGVRHVCWEIIYQKYKTAHQLVYIVLYSLVSHLSHGSVRAVGALYTVYGTVHYPVVLAEVLLI
jgi:hypothetical protein